MPKRRARSRITLLTSVPRRHRERLQEVLQTYDRLTQATALAEHRAEVEARYVARMKETGRPPVDDRPRHRDRAGRLSMSEVRRVLGEHGPGLALMNDALGDTVRHQRRVLREAMIQRRTLEYSLGNPTELRCLWTAASVTASTSPLVTSTGNVTTSPLVTTTGSGRNRLSTVALTTTQPALASLALVSIPTTHIFSFTATQVVIVTPTVFLAPVGTFSLIVPSPTYIPLFWQAVAKATVQLSAVVDVVVTAASGAPATLLPPRATFSFLDFTISGWTGAATQVGSLGGSVGGGQATMSPGTFAVQAGDTVSIAVGYRLFLRSWEGGVVLVDASTVANAGLNVPSVWVRLDL